MVAGGDAIHAGTDYQTDVEHDIVTLGPTEDSWGSGDRAVTCLVTGVDGAQLTGSALR